MNKNQKIAVGCGAAGCLGLIVVALAAGVFFYWRSQESYERRTRNFNFNTNSTNSNRNSNSNENQNTSASESSSNDTAATVSDDDKHKLFQAVGMTKDAELMQKVLKKIGLFKADGTPVDEYPQFIKEHFTWALKNTAFITSVNTPEKARAYVDAHMED